MRQIHKQVNLIIEQGNTSTKVGIFDKNTLVESKQFRTFGIEPLTSLFRQYPLSSGIFSTVTDSDKEFVAYLNEHLEHFINLEEEVKLPIKIGYKTPKTLGSDRIAAAVGAVAEQPGKDLLVIDAGTCITYELITSDGLYHGGNISPGLTTRFRSLHAFTRRLPLIEEAEEVPLTGTTTETAIRAGVVNGIVYEIDGTIDAVKKTYPSLLVFLTGGHSFYFAGRLKNLIFADINLVLKGLNRILEYNVDKQ